MEFIFLALLLGLIPAIIAQRKGHSFAAYYLGGVLLLVVALPMAILADPHPDKFKRCPECRKFVDRMATRCEYCHAQLAARR